MLPVGWGPRDPRFVSPPRTLRRHDCLVQAARSCQIPNAWVQIPPTDRFAPWIRPFLPAGCISGRLDPARPRHLPAGCVSDGLDPRSTAALLAGALELHGV